MSAGAEQAGAGPEVDVMVDGQLPTELAAALDALVTHTTTAALAALAALDLKQVELSIVLCDDAVMQPLNLQWRGVDATTDVLSFPQDDGLSDLAPPEQGGGLVLPAGMLRPLGDLVISLTAAQRQASDLGHSLQAELSVLVVHGLLHLLGHDHETGPQDAARMQAEERRVLVAIGGGAGLVERAG